MTLERVRARGARGRAAVAVAFLALDLGAASAQAPAPAPARPAVTPTPSPGELLYTTHCGECHSTQIHWREKTLASDWPALVGQVRRWQGNLGLNWTDADIVDVARYLNERFYRYPSGAPGVAMTKRRTGG